MLGILSRLLSTVSRGLIETVRYVYDVATGIFVRRVQQHPAPPAPRIDIDAIANASSEAVEMSRAAASIKRHAVSVQKGHRPHPLKPDVSTRFASWLDALTEPQIENLARQPLSRVREHISGRRIIPGLPEVGNQLKAQLASEARAQELKRAHRKALQHAMPMSQIGKTPQTVARRTIT